MENKIEVYLNVRGYEAEGMYDFKKGTLEVFAGSTFSRSTSESLQKSYQNLRKQLINNENIVSGNKFIKNYLFTAPSSASAVLTGTSTNGKILWKSAEGITLKEMIDRVSPEDSHIQNRMQERSEEPKEIVNEDEDVYKGLNEIFIDNNKVEKIIRLLKRKKNIIFQGVPGVGKTFVIERIIKHGFKVGEKNIQFVQFHQSFSYEEFIEGLRPNLDGSYTVEAGIFKEFVDRTKEDRDSPYFMIIDEVNRGNISKIFGELLVLIENDKRNKSKVILPYSKEEFSIPDNLYIICTMNTADRSLSLVDYALRRRFSFITLEPAFNNEKFKRFMVKNCNYTEQEVQLIVDDMNKVNAKIIEYLGVNFQIGHSYFVQKKPVGTDFDELRKEILEYDIIPTLEEYFFDEEDKVDEFRKDLNLI